MTSTRLESLAASFMASNAHTIAARPVVVSHVGGLPEVVENGKTGLVVPKEDAASAAAAMAALLGDEERRAAMGAAGRARVLEKYEWRSCVDRQLAVIKSAIDKRARS